MNEQPIIEINNLGKEYDIRHARGGYIALRDVIMNVLKSPFRYAKDKVKQVTGFAEKEEFWALKDINIKINRGEVVGIIGANGAGKSTLLKILTGITPPTEGEAILRGRVSSLLEVGTGFHPELTGRDNIFLNGAILGMKKREIQEKFDEIVAFAGIEKFLDTPVKHYSSGMYVRLAFSVAAHMEPDILIIDEVLAVGDAEFQKKCLGKMEEVTNKQGRTIIFVSHNMATIQSLCKKCILLEKGKIKKSGETRDIIEYYTSDKTSKSEVTLIPESDEAGVTKIWLEDKEGAKVSSVEMGEDIFLNIEYIIKKDVHILDIGARVSKNGMILLQSFNIDSNEILKYNQKCGKYRNRVKLPTSIFKEGIYLIEVVIGTDRNISDLEAIIKFEIMNTILDVQNKSYHPERAGLLYMNLDWEITNI